MRELQQKYKADFQSFDKETWNNCLNLFQDACLYQSWAYDRARAGLDGFTHMILRKGDSLVAAAQIRLYRFPVIGGGIAYVFWGPMWRSYQVPENKENFRQAVRALRHEFSCKRGFMLRIFPQAYQSSDGELGQILGEEGYGRYEDGKVHRTLVIDLEPSLESLRASLDQKWRNCLNRAEKNNLELIWGDDEDSLDQFKTMYEEMIQRKDLSGLSDVGHLKVIQEDLAPQHRLKVLFCRVDGQPCAGAIFSAIGDSAVYLYGATSNQGMKSNGSYLIQWAWVRWLKEKGFRYYNLNGINPQCNPGTYHFKRGLAGKQGRDVEYLGKYQVTDQRVRPRLLQGGEQLVGTFRRLFRPGKSSLQS